jgi:hypothetical protein
MTSKYSEFLPKAYPGLTIPSTTDDLQWSRSRAMVHTEATDTASGAEAFPQIYLRTYRNVAGAGGLVGWIGKNSTPAFYTFAQLVATITTLTAGAEGGKLDLQVAKAGVLKQVSVSGDDAAVIPGTTADFALGIDGKRFTALYLGSTSGTVKGDVIPDAGTSAVVIGAKTNHPLNFKTNDTVRGGFDALGNFAHKKAIVDQSYSLQVPTTGFSITVGAGVSALLLNPAGTLATGTITMPAAPIDGQIVRLGTTQTITTLTLSPNAGQTISGAVTTLTASAPATYQYVVSITKWIRIA